MERFNQYMLKGGDSPVQSLFSTSAYIAVTCILVLVTVYYRYNAVDGLAKFPDFDPLKWFEFTNTRRTRVFIDNSISTFINARARFGDKPFKLSTDWGNVLILSPKMLDSIKSDKRLSFAKAASDDSHAYIPGFEPFQESPAIINVVTKYLTKSLTKLTAPLSEEAYSSLRTTLTDSSEWHDFQVFGDIMSIVSRLSSRVFMGPELCQDDSWNEASMRYTAKAVEGILLLTEYPRWMRPLIHRFLPTCWEVRSTLAEAKRHLQPHIERRNRLKRDLAARGEDKQFNDSIEWLELEQPDLDPAISQITLSLVAIHTTSDLLAQTAINIALHPELFDPLRAEAVSVLRAEGLKKTALYNLKLMDSVIKESQRLKPIAVGGFRRLATEDMTLPDGTFLKKGTKIVIDSTHMWSTDYYDNADQFDGYRFLRMREASSSSSSSSSERAQVTGVKSNKHAHLVSTSASHLGFGHGLHSCPGRFFAANEIKITLCHLLLMYDWKLPEHFSKGDIQGSDFKPIVHGMGLATNPKAKLLIRRREEEIDFSSLSS